MRPQRCVLVKYGELMLKGQNHAWFERHLFDRLERAVAGLEHPVHTERRGGVIVLTSDAPQEQLLQRAKLVIGLSLVQPALRAEQTPEAAAEAVVQLIGEQYDTAVPRRFAIRARRRRKEFPLTSDQLASRIGQRVRDAYGWPVDLDEPEVEVNVEVDRSEIFASLAKHRGQGGLPVGTSGRALVLLSGGYDSPVAGYRAMRRGLRCDFVHFTGAPYTNASSIYKAYALVRQLNRYQGDAKLHVVSVGHAQRALATAGASGAQMVAQRRLYLQVAEVLAKRIRARALVTGDSLGQVSSQTLTNLANTEQAASLPLLRPLLAWDKDEIVAEAQRIGTGDISVLPDEDCCTMLAPPRVETRTSAKQLERIEQRVDVEDWIGKVLANAQIMEPEDPNASPE